MGDNEDRRGKHQGKGYVSHGTRGTHAIGTWRNLYGYGHTPPQDRQTDSRGLMVPGTGKPKGGQ